jgi:hypothetical protein
MGNVILILYAIALVIAILNGVGRSRGVPLWVAVAILAAIPILTRLMLS